MRVFENERGISNLIATLILIAVAVVGGAFAYTAFRNQAQSATTNADLRVQSLNAVKPAGASNATVSATVKNVGTVRLNSVTLTITNESGDNQNISLTSGLSPGGTKSGSMSIDLNAGKEYIVSITASGPNASISDTMTVRV